jgi:pimeloyl-ACP methyl ester carboxylesterase
MVKRKYPSKKRKTTKKKSGKFKFIKILLLILALLSLLFYLNLRNWKTQKIDLFKKESQIVNTSLGAIEYMSMGSGPIILLSHMGGSGADNIKLFNTFVNKGYRIICPSRPGYHQTPLVSNADFSYQADIFAELLANLNITEKVFIAGISIGGPAAIQFAIKYPSRCKGLLLYSAVTQKFTPLDDEEQLANVYKIMSSFLWQDAYSWIQSKGSKVLPTKFTFELLKRAAIGSPEELKELAVLLMKEDKNKAAANLFNNVTSPFSIRMQGFDNDLNYAKSFNPNYSKIKTPVFIAHSRIDKVVKVKHARSIKQKIKNTDYFEFDGSGHAFWLGDEWAQIENKTIDFLKKNNQKKAITNATLNQVLTSTIWVSNDDGALLKINNDNSFSVDFSGVDKNKSIKGKVVIKGSKISFITSKKSLYHTDKAGVYQFKIKNDELKLTVIKDKSKRRREHFTKGWFKL